VSATTPCVLVVADASRIPELAAALAEHASIEVVTTSGGDETIDLITLRRPWCVVLAASLEHGDSKSLIDTVRGIIPRAEVGVVLVGDDNGPIKTALDALDLQPDRFVARPLAAKALRFAVESCLEQVGVVRGSPRTKTDKGTGMSPTSPAPTNGAEQELGPAGSMTRGGAADVPAPTPSREALRARWEALADEISDDDVVEEPPASEAPPLPPPLVIHPRRAGEPEWAPGNTAELREEWQDAPAREPTLILREEPPKAQPPAGPPERWSRPLPLAELGGRDTAADELDDFDPDIPDGATPPPHVIRGGELIPLVDARTDASAIRKIPEPSPPPPPPPAAPERPSSRDFARQLRAKMSMMAQRLFQQDAGTPATVDVAPHHDHQTEIDLAALGEEPALNSGGVTEIEGRARAGEPQITTSPGSWDTQVRERGLPDSGEIVRGISDAAMLLAKIFAQGTTGRASFRIDDVEKVVFFDQGRPVFASSNEPGDRMGELLVREGKITAAQYERCQVHATTSGRRMGEILVDFGYLKRRELLPAVRRHVEDIIYSLFGWDSGHYRVNIDTSPSAERIRLSRHPASLILEGVRRKLDRSTLERLVGPASTVVEVPDRERLGGIMNLGDLAPEERAALAALDGHADLSHVARAAGVDLVDLLPLAWGLCVLGLGTARRVEADIEESTALVGETDLAIDRERVRARWQLVGEADYFALLGVRRDATGFEIRRAYQAARRDFAADCFPTDLRRELARELDEIASVIDEAFRVLRDDRLRLTYLSNLVE
jgi:DNA-binding NarL/FixJ family response regulator